MFVGGIVALYYAVSYVQLRVERRRDVAYAAYCVNHNFRYTAARDGAQEQYVDYVAFFSQGYARKWRHEISGTVGGRTFTAFEYTYTIGSGKYMQVYHQAVVRWEDNDAHLPAFTLAPESFFDRIGQKITGQPDIDFTEDPAFSNAYALDGFNQGELTTMFAADVREFVVSHPGQHIAAQGGVLFWWQPRRLPPADQLDAFLAASAAVAQVFLSRR
jgi:hypothetical protein